LLMLTNAKIDPENAGPPIPLADVIAQLKSA